MTIMVPSHEDKLSRNFFGDCGILRIFANIKPNNRRTRNQESKKKELRCIPYYLSLTSPSVWLSA